MAAGASAGVGRSRAAAVARVVERAAGAAFELGDGTAAGTNDASVLQEGRGVAVARLTKRCWRRKSEKAKRSSAH